ncbi:MAG TPA: NUDIX hydrolase [Candidatus Binatia bacterium]|nr:NUDIX hydrolase [Candidatus Binatia bacterium]
MAEQVFQIGIKGLIRNDNGDIFMLHIPEWGYNPAHWDLPGGRMDSGETFLETLKRELIEEIGASYTGKPKQIMGMLTNITIPVGNELLPLVFMIYEVNVADINKIKLSEDTREDKAGWFSPKEAAKLMSVKFSPEFCELASKL